jgi:DNA-binding transcriptional MerR regulator
MAKRYSSDHKDQIIHTIAAAKDKGMGVPEIANHLNELKIPTATGLLWDETRTDAFIYQYRRMIGSRRASRSIGDAQVTIGRRYPKKDTAISRTVLMDILTNQTLNHKQIVGMLTAYLDV